MREFLVVIQGVDVTPQPNCIINLMGLYTYDYFNYSKRIKL